MSKRGTVYSFLAAVLLAGMLQFAAAADVARMTKEELKEHLAKQDVTVVDVRTARDWDDSAVKIKGAMREDPRNVKSWVGSIPKDRTLVLYCA